MSNLIRPDQVFVSPAAAQRSKQETLGQLAAMHARIHGLQISSILERVKTVELRDGFAIAHGPMERTPRI
jgi:hypothetical protein